MVGCFGRCRVCLRRLRDCLPLTFSVGIAALLGWLLVFAAMAHLTYGIHFQRGTFGWHALVAGLYGVAAINLLVNPLLGVVLLALVVGVVLIAEGIVEIALFLCSANIAIPSGS